MIFVEVIETPQRDWWVVADGRLVGLHLKTADCPEPYQDALERAEELAKPYGFRTLGAGTTWRSLVFDHVEDLSCRRGVCCRMREMTDAEQKEFVRAERRALSL